MKVPNGYSAPEWRLHMKAQRAYDAWLADRTPERYASYVAAAAIARAYSQTHEVIA
jgi:hypothetical protein